MKCKRRLATIKYQKDRDASSNTNPGLIFNLASVVETMQLVIEFRDEIPKRGL